MPDIVRIGNAQGFWGDAVDAPARLLREQPDLDYLTLDYLAEVSLSILAMQKDRDPSLGFARDFLDVVRDLAPYWAAKRGPRLIANSGGLNPTGCANATAEILKKAGCQGLKIGVVSGDDCLETLRDAPVGEFANLDTGAGIEVVAPRLVTANAYLGAEPMVQALSAGAQIVITGRVADPSMVLAACRHAFNWSPSDWDRMAAGTIAGHLLECGTQVTGGISTDWLEIEEPARIGFPVLEVARDGALIVTKPAGTTGRVTPLVVKEQLLYEIADPGNYVSPDVVVSFLGLVVEDVGEDRVRVRGAIGQPATEFYKVSATYREGYRSNGSLTIFGRHAVRKARRAGVAVFEKLASLGITFDESLIECLGTGACVAGIPVGSVDEDALLETVLRLGVKDRRKEVVERFTRELAPLVTAGPQGTTGYAAGRPSVQPVFGYWPCLITKIRLQPTVTVLDV